MEEIVRIIKADNRLGVAMALTFSGTDSVPVLFVKW